MSRSTSKLVVLGLTISAVVWSSAAHAATQRQETSGSRDEVTTGVPVTWGSNTVVGSLLVGIVSLKGTAATTITPPAGRGWTQAVRSDDGVVSVAIYYVANAAVQTTAAQSWAVSGALPAVVQLIEYQGVNTTSPLDLTATGTGYGTSASVTSATTTSQAAELAITGIAVHRRPTLTVAGSDFAQVGTTTQTGGTSGATGTRVSGASYENLYTGTSKPTTTITFSGTTTRDWATAMVTFKLPTKYWIGGCTGNAFSTNACWSSTSGGAANTTVPGTSEVAIFDGAGATGQNSPVFGTTTTIGAIDVKSTYTGTLSVGTGKTLTINTDLSVAGGSFTGGGMVTFSTASLHISGGTVSGNGSAFAPSDVGVSGGTYNTGTATHGIVGDLTLSGGAINQGTGNLTVGGTLTMTGGNLTTGGTVTVTGNSTIAGGGFTNAAASKVTTFSGNLALSGTGAVLTNLGTFTVSGAMSLAGSSTYGGAASTTTNFADFDMTGGTVTTGSGTVNISNNVTISGGTYRNTGTSTTLITSTSTLGLSGTGAVSVTGGTMHVTRAVTMAGTSTYTSATGATNTFDTTFAVNGGTFTLGGGSIDVTGAVTIGGGTYSGAGSSDFASTLDVDSGTFNANGGTVTVAGAVRVRGGTYMGNATFSSTLAVSAGTFDTNGGTVAVTGAVTISGGDYSGTGTNTFSNALTVSSGSFDADGGTVGVSGLVTISGGTYDSTGSISTFSKATTPALSVTSGTIDASGGTIRVPNSNVTISGGTFQTTTGSATFGGTVTVSGTGIYDGSGGSSTTTGLVTVSGGTYKIGSSATGQTLNGGMTISGGTLDGSSTTGALKLGASQTLAMSSGTLQTSTASIAGPTFGATGVAWLFSITGGTVSLNGGKLVGTTGTNGLSINAATVSKLDYVNFANIPGSNPGTATYLLSITENAFTLRSTGCKFDYNGATFTNLKTVKLSDSNATTVDVRAWFQLKDTATNGAAAGDAYDADDDNPTDDGVGDVNNKAVVYWSYAVATDTAGTIAGFPTAAFDWNSGNYYSTYAAFNNASGTTDRIYVRDADGNPVSSYDITDATSTIVGTPLWTTEGTTHVVYVSTSAGKIYRLIDTAGTLARDTSFTSDTRVTAITSPLIDDGTNLYFGCTFSGATSIVALRKSTGLVVRNVGALASVTASPSWKISGGTTYLFSGTAKHATMNKGYIYRVDMVPAAAVTAVFSNAVTAIGSSTRYAGGTLYAGDGNGILYGIDALSAGFTNKTGFPYQDFPSARHANNTVGAIQGAPWVDVSNSLMFFGDNDGHLYKLSTSGTLDPTYPIKLSTNQIAVSPIYIAGTGVVIAGDSGGNVFYVDVHNLSDAPALMYTTTLSGAVSTISFNASTAKFMVGTANGLFEMLPVKTDPTPTHVH